MNLLVIGSDSFIAQHFITNYKEKFRITSISRIRTNINSDILASDLFHIPIEHFNGNHAVINFAAIVHRPNIKDPKIYEEVNYRLTVLNAQRAKEADVKFFVQISTISVYGNSTNISIKDTYNPQNLYALSKLKADEALLKMQDDSFKVAIVRPPMVYGGGKAPGNMLRLINLVNKGIPLPFKGIDNRRDFINVSNLIQYLAIIIEKKLNGIFLVHDHESVSTTYLLNTIAKYSYKKVNLIFPPPLLLSLMKRIALNEYLKLFGSLSIKTNFPYEELIIRQSVDKGIQEMVNCYIESRNTNNKQIFPFK